MSEFTTLANVKSWLRLSVDTADTDLARLIEAASTFIESRVNRNLLTATYTETYNGQGGYSLVLPNRPVTEVASVSINGLTVPSTSWSSQAPAGYMFDRLGIHLVGGYVFHRGVQNVSVIYTGGYATVPPDIEQLCIELVAMKFKERERIGEQSKNVAGQYIQYRTADLTRDQLDVINSYRRVAPV